MQNPLQELKTIVEQGEDLSTKIRQHLKPLTSDKNQIDHEMVIECITYLLEHVENRDVLTGMFDGVSYLIDGLPHHHSLKVDILNALPLERLLSLVKRFEKDMTTMRAWCHMVGNLSTHIDNKFTLLQTLPSVLKAMEIHDDFYLQQCGCVFLSIMSIAPATRQHLLDSTAPEACIRAMKLHPKDEKITRVSSIFFSNLILILGAATLLALRGATDAIHSAKVLHSESKDKKLKLYLSCCYDALPTTQVAEQFRQLEQQLSLQKTQNASQQEQLATKNDELGVIRARVDELETEYERIHPEHSSCSILCRPEINPGDTISVRTSHQYRTIAKRKCSGPSPQLEVVLPDGSTELVELFEGDANWTHSVPGNHTLQLTAGPVSCKRVVMATAANEARLEHPQPCAPRTVVRMEPVVDGQQLEEYLCCANCGGLPFGPRVLDCPDRDMVCWGCWIQEGDTMACHRCKTGSEHKLILISRALRKTLEDLWGACPFCEEEVQIVAFEEHLQTCPHAPLECEHAPRGCTEVVERRNMEDHVARECECRLVRCSLCHFQCMQKDIGEHEVRCREVRVIDE
eukprot:gnl/Dysnectes_brevis/866_a959_2406.p1 GENE.gnl/Dysnectes_brevis/866_a959_2406~~gnl/Dysnectes_brevis/866_a959_2406.p1  ORF type:complete len:573 (-),score=117.12 gnl/Dysnectes_brevis/866_a959_2406:109-1827(-)